MDSIMGEGRCCSAVSSTSLCLPSEACILRAETVLATLASASQLEDSDEVKLKRKDISKCQGGHYGVYTRG